MSNPRQSNVRPLDFYQTYFSYFLALLIGAIIVLILLAGFVLYQVTHRPLPPFIAVASNGKQMSLVSYKEPNYLPSTLIQWASKATVAAYTFDFARNQQQLAMARPYFTDAGWVAYQSAVSSVIAAVVQRQLIVNGVVVGTPVISNSGDMTGHGYTWRIQLPFLVTTQSADAIDKKSFMVVLTIVKVPTTQNPAGVGIDQFVMMSGS